MMSVIPLLLLVLFALNDPNPPQHLKTFLFEGKQIVGRQWRIGRVVPLVVKETSFLALQEFCFWLWNNKSPLPRVKLVPSWENLNQCACFLELLVRICQLVKEMLLSKKEDVSMSHGPLKLVFDQFLCQKSWGSDGKSNPMGKHVLFQHGEEERASRWLTEMILKKNKDFDKCSSSHPNFSINFLLHSLQAFWLPQTNMHSQKVISQSQHVQHQRLIHDSDSSNTCSEQAIELAGCTAQCLLLFCCLALRKCHSTKLIVFPAFFRKSEVTHCTQVVMDNSTSLSRSWHFCFLFPSFWTAKSLSCTL